MKKKILLGVLLVCVFATGVGASEAYREFVAKEVDYKIYHEGDIFHGEPMHFDLPIVTVEDHTYVPMRELFENSGYQVDWSEKEHKIILSNGDDFEKRYAMSGEPIAIPDEEMALKIGRIILEKHFYIDEDEKLKATKEDGIWTVRNVKEEPKVLENGLISYGAGGGVYTKFRERDGEILSIELGD